MSAYCTYRPVITYYSIVLLLQVATNPTFSARVECEPPNNRLDKFVGKFEPKLD